MGSVIVKPDLTETPEEKELPIQLRVVHAWVKFLYVVYVMAAAFLVIVGLHFKATASYWNSRADREAELLQPKLSYNLAPFTYSRAPGTVEKIHVEFRQPVPLREGTTITAIDVWVQSSTGEWDPQKVKLTAEQMVQETVKVLVPLNVETRKGKSVQARATYWVTRDGKLRPLPLYASEVWVVK